MGEWIDNEEIVKTFLKSYMTFLIQKEKNGDNKNYAIGCHRNMRQHTGKKKTFSF